MRNLILLGLIFLAGVASAAENQTDQADQQETATESNTESNTETASPDSELILDEETVSEEESPERFIPTEEISQDFGVSFPVDI